MTRYVDVIKRVIQNTDRTAHLLDAVVQGIANQSALFNEKASQIVEGLANLAGVSHRKFDEAILGVRNHSQMLDERLKVLIANQQVQLELQRTQAEMLAKLVSAISNAQAK